MLFPRWSSLAFILCVLSVCLQGQPLDVPSVEDSITVFEGVKSQLRFVNNVSPTVFAFPKDKHGRVVEAYWAALSLLQFRELRCSTLLPTFSFFHIFRLEGVLGNCSEEGQHVTDLLVPAKWEFDTSEENLLRFSLPGLGGAASLFVGTFEYVPEAKNVTSRNKAGTERRMRVEGDSLKISFDVYNYTSQTVTDLNEDSQLADSFFQMRFKLKMELSHAIVPVVLSQNPVLTFPVSISPSDTSEHQLTYFIDVLNDLFRVRVSQALFSVTEPPVGSTVVAEEAEWGFEPVNGVMVWNASNTEATDQAFVFELHFSGGERLSYDPGFSLYEDISILLNNEHESENGKAESDDDEDAVVIAVSIVVPVVVVASVAFVAVVAWLRHSRKARRVSRLSTVISKHVDA